MSRINTTTRSRITRAAAALLGGEVSADEKDIAVIDLLTNLRHYCDHHQFDFAKLDRLAYQRYIAEASEARSSGIKRKSVESFAERALL